MESNLCIISSDIGIDMIGEKQKQILNPKVALMFCFTLTSSLGFTQLNYVEINIQFSHFVSLCAAFLGFTVVFLSVTTCFAATCNKTRRRLPEHKSW